MPVLRSGRVLSSLQARDVDLASFRGRRALLLYAGAGDCAGCLEWIEQAASHRPALEEADASAFALLDPGPLRPLPTPWRFTHTAVLLDPDEHAAVYAVDLFGEVISASVISEAAAHSSLAGPPQPVEALVSAARACPE